MAPSSKRQRAGQTVDESHTDSGLVVPEVTEEDLLTFQIAHFNDDSVPATWFVDAGTALEYEGNYDEDDGLGYYADGVKRTLTDEQIAIFRNSEIQRLVREERLRQEEAAEAMENSTSAATVADLPEERHSDGRSRSTGSTTPNRPPPRRSSEVPYDQRHKRKWEGYIEDVDPRQGSLTHRRIVRELDQAGEESVDLDY